MGYYQSMDTIDVLIPFHLLNDYLIESINSAKNSKGVNIRVIAINDTGIITNKSFLGLSRIDVLIQNHGKGYLDALKTGVDAASSDFLGFLDSDDLTDPTRFKRQIDFLKSSNMDFVTGKLVRMNENGQLSNRKSILGAIPENLSIREKLIFGPHGADSAIVGKTSKFKETWGVHSTFSSSFADYGWLLSVLSEYSIGHCPTAVYYYRSHAFQMSRRSSDMNNWNKIVPIWENNLNEVLGIPMRSLNSITSNSCISLAIAFPAAMRFVKPHQFKYLLRLSDSILDHFTEINFNRSQIKESLNRRLFLATRGYNPRYWLAGFNILNNILKNYFLGIKPRIGR